MVTISCFEFDGFGHPIREIRLMPILELQILSPIRGVGLSIIVFNEGASAANQKEFHQFLPVFLAFTALEGLDTSYKVFVLLGKLPFTTNLTDIGLWTNTQVGVIIYKQTQLAAQIFVLFVIGCSCKQQYFAILFLYQISDIAIAHTLTVAQVVALVYDDELVVACIVYIDRFCHRYNICLQVILFTILCPHILQVGRTDYQRVAAKGVFIHFRNSTSCYGFSQSNNVSNHCSTTFLIVKMTGSNLYSCLLKVKKTILKFCRNRKLFNSRACFFT